MEEKKINGHRVLNSIKRLFWVQISRFETNHAIKNKVDAKCDERINHFKDKWEKKRQEKMPPGLLKEIEDCLEKIINLGILNYKNLLNLLGGKTLNLKHSEVVKYYDHPGKWDFYNKDLLKESLKSLRLENLIITTETIPQENMKEAIAILKSHGHILSEIDEDINESALLEKIANGEIKVEVLNGLRRKVNQYFAVTTPTPNAEIRKVIKTITEEY